MTVVATAGHVDHGKSTLVRALTGVDPDRLPEEKARGLTLDLGFASCRLPSGRTASFVDVPGHERLVGTMLAGVGPAAACLFVVDATEGWRAQSEEHLRIVDLLGVAQAVVALTRSAAVESGQLALVDADVRRHLAATALSHAPIVAVDAPAGVGVEQLVDALDTALGRLPLPVDLDRPRIWVDRSFTIRGAGTVVTGTLGGGPLSIDDRLEVRHGENIHPVRVRGIEEHGVAVDSTAPGSRVALNLVGVAHQDIARGAVVVRPGQWTLVDRFEVDLRVLDDSPAVERRGSHLVHVGTDLIAARLDPLGARQLGPGQVGTVRVVLHRPAPIAVGDRLVVRDAGRATTVAGGTTTSIERTSRTRSAPPPLGRALPPDAQAYLDELRLDRFRTRRPDDVGGTALAALRSTGAAVSENGCWFAVDAVDAAAAMVITLLTDRPEGVRVSDVRNALGTSRRHALALLAILDRRGVTRRVGERRRAGPRASSGADDVPAR